LKASLKMIKMEPEQMRASRKYRVPVYVSEQENTEEQNIFISLASIVSPTNMFPIHLSTSIRSAFNGEATEENLQLSMSQKNLEQWYERIAEFTRQYTESNEEEKDNMERRSAKDLRQIYSSLGIKNRRSGSYFLSSEDDSTEEMRSSKKVGDNQPFGMICLRSNDVDKTIIPISESHLPEIVRKMIKGEKPNILSHFDQMSQRLASGEHFRQHIAMTVGEKRVKIPTTAGLPLSLVRLTCAVGSVEGELKIRFESDNLDSQRGMTAQLRMRTSGIASHQHKVEVWCPVIISGVETTRTVELNGPIEMRLRTDSKKVELKFVLPQEHKVRIAALHTLPITYTRQFEMPTRNLGVPRVKTVHNWALEHTQREHHSEQWQGHAFQVQGHYHEVSSLKQILQALYTTENSIHINYVPSERTPKELTLRLIGQTFEKYSEHSRPEMESFYPSKRGFEHIYPEDFENMELEQDEDRRSRISSYSQQYSGKNSYKHQIRLEAEAHCGPKTHKVSVELKGACDAYLKHCKLFIDAERTPMQSESQEWKMSAKIQTVAPEIIDEEEEPNKKQSRMLVQLDSNWGSDKKNQMNVRIQAEPTRKGYWRPNTSNKWSRFLNKIDLVADYKLHSTPKQWINRFYEVAKAKYFWSLNVEDRRSNEEGLVRATLVIDPITRKHANISVQTPTERLRLEQIELPVRMSPYSLQRRPESVRSFGHLIQSVTNYGGAECKVDERRVSTFDGVTYRSPLSSCWSVLAKDCSREDPRFVVLMKKDNEEKKVKIITQDKTIELIRKEQKKPIVKIDGRMVTDEQELSEEGVELSYNQAYVRKSDLSIQFDGEECKVKVSGMYKNLQCGLCGHYNDEDHDDLRMNNGQRSNSVKEFHRSYTLKNEECDENRLTKFYQDNSDEFEIERSQQKRRPQEKGWFESSDESESDETYGYKSKSNEEKESRERSDRREQSDRRQPVKRTKVMEYQHQICFSTEPVKQCPRGYAPEEEEEKKTVKFFCLERSSSEARRLQRQVREGRIVESEGHQQSFTEQFEQPTKCQSVY